MTIDSLTLAAVAAELRRRAADHRLGAVLVPRREQVIFGLGGGGLFVSIAAHDARCHLTGDLPAPPRPAPSLQTHLDSLLRGGELLDARTLHFDRVLELRVGNLDRVGEPRRYRVVIELMGKHSACCVLDESNTILATLKTVTSAVNRHRQLLPQLPYRPPPDGGRLDPLTLTAEGFAELWTELAAAASLKDGWRRSLLGLSDPLWGELCRRAELPPDIATAEPAVRDALWSAWEQIREVVANDRYQPCLVPPRGVQPPLAWPLPLPGGEPVDSISAAIERLAREESRERRLRERRGQLLGAVRRGLKLVESQLSGVARKGRQAAEADLWRRRADLILANLAEIAPRASAVELVDWTEPESPPLRIELDPALTGPQNAELFYTRARQARQAGEGLAADQDRLVGERERLVALRDRLETAGTESELESLASDAPALPAVPAPRPKPRNEREKALRKLGRVRSSDGYDILIGRNAQESEGLLSRIAAPTDLWFHVRGAGSGHVIVRAQGRPEAVPRATLEEAAVQAARQSKMKHSEIVPVVYTQRKHVTKVKGGQAGKVVYRQEQTLFVNPRVR